MSRPASPARKFNTNRLSGRKLNSRKRTGIPQSRVGGDDYSAALRRSGKSWEQQHLETWSGRSFKDSPGSAD